MSPFQRLLSDGGSMGHSLVEIDGKHCKPTRHEILAKIYPMALVRIGRHLYIDQQGLTVGAPEWSKLFPERLMDKV